MNETENQSIEQKKMQENFTDETETKLASFSERFLAYFIDVLPFAVLAKGTIYYLSTVKNIIFTLSTQMQIALAWALVYILYVSIFHAISGATIGKKILAIKIIDIEGGGVSFWQALIRAVGYFISAVPLYFGFLMVLLNSQKRALHDYIARTVVIKTRKRSRFGQGLVFALSLGIMILLAGSWGYVMFYRFSPQNIKMITIAKQHLRYLQELQEIHKNRYGVYTDDLNKLAIISGDADLFRKRILYAFGSGNFVINAGENSYYMSAYAKNRAKTPVKVSKP